jgi:hypothetical protein
MQFCTEGYNPRSMTTGLRERKTQQTREAGTTALGALRGWIADDALRFLEGGLAALRS